MKIKSWAIGIFCLFLLEGILFLITSAPVPEKAVASDGEGVIRKSVFAKSFTEEEEPESESQTDQSDSIDQSRKSDQKVRKIYQKYKKTLLLVNAEHELSDSYNALLQPICHGRLYASKRLYPSLVQMLADAEQEGYRFWIASAYRSRKKQQSLVDADVQEGMKQGLSYQEALQRTYRETMPAGYSEHQTGLALDILCSDNTAMDASQEKERGNQWLQKNSYRYGFILRYPKGKQDITGIDYEPWHFRYVGEGAAEYIKKNNLTLEEFWDKIQ